MADITSLTKGWEIVQDYVTALTPISYQWHYMGEATGSTILTLHCHGGNVLVSIYTGNGFINQTPEGEANTLPPEILAQEATLAGVQWQDPDFKQIPPIRGVQINDSKQDLLQHFLRTDPNNHILYDISALNPKADSSWIHNEWVFIGGRIMPQEEKNDSFDEIIEYVYSDLQTPDQWREYYILQYYIKQGIITGITLAYDTDSE